MIQPPHFLEEAAEEIEHERHWYRERSHTAENLFLRKQLALYRERQVKSSLAAPMMRRGSRS